MLSAFPFLVTGAPKDCWEIYFDKVIESKWGPFTRLGFVGHNQFLWITPSHTIPSLIGMVFIHNHRNKKMWKHHGNGPKWRHLEKSFYNKYCRNNSFKTKTDQGLTQITNNNTLNPHPLKKRKPLFLQNFANHCPRCMGFTYPYSKNLGVFENCKV